MKPTMKATTLLALILAHCLLTSACARSCERQSGLKPEQAAEARRTVVAWLECEECDEKELEAVVKLGPIIIPSLIAALRQGPSPANREVYRRHLVKTYRDLKSYQKTHPESKVTIQEEEYVKTYLDNYQALYQVHAATALGAIGGANTRKALEEALRSPLRDDVRKVVNDSLEKLKDRK